MESTPDRGIQQRYYGVAISYYVEKRQGKRKTSYRVQVIIKNEGRIIHRENHSFTVYKNAVSFGASRDKLLQKALKEDPEYFQELIEQKAKGGDTLADEIERYKDNYAERIGRTVNKDLELLAVPIWRIFDYAA